MKIKLMSVHDAWDYCMDHYYPAGLAEFAQRTDSYAIISIQDAHTQGFGFTFCESACCKGALTLLFDDVERANVEGAVAFDDGMAQEIVEFINAQRDVETLVVHCYAGRSRSRAVASFAARYLGEPDIFQGECGNSLVRETLEKYL